MVNKYKVGEFFIYHVENSNNNNDLLFRVEAVKKDYIMVKLLYNHHLDTKAMSFFLKRPPFAEEPSDVAYKFGRVYGKNEIFNELFDRIFSGNIKRASEIQHTW
jgi:hypothetical protein